MAQVAKEATLEVSVTNGGVPLGCAVLTLRDAHDAESGRRVVIGAGFFAPLQGYAPIAAHARDVYVSRDTLPTGPVAVCADADLPHLPDYTLRLPLALVGRDGVEIPAATISLMQLFRERDPKVVHVAATFDEAGAPIGALRGAWVLSAGESMLPSEQPES
jgi:hypothetical protein